MHYNFGSKLPHVPQPDNILEKPLKFHVPYGPFYCAKLKYNFHVPLDTF